MMECAFCGEEMENYQANNPYPFFVAQDDARVCGSCDNFVTSTRLTLMAVKNLDMREIDIFQDIIQGSFALRNSRLAAEEYLKEMKRMNKEEKGLKMNAQQLMDRIASTSHQLYVKVLARLSESVPKSTGVWERDDEGNMIMLFEEEE